MRNFILPSVCLVLWFVCPAGSQAGAAEKYSDLAGTWYRSSPAALNRELSEYLKNARLPRKMHKVVSVISPHAGLDYSGSVAAHSFKALQPERPETIIIVGFTHKKHLPGTISVFDAEAFVTPLGRALIDADVTSALLSYDPSLRYVPEAFEGENSIEMLIPLAQAALPEAKLALVAIGDQNEDTAKVLAEALYKVLLSGKNVVMVASADMSHYLPEEQAVKKDKLTIDKLSQMDPEEFYRYSVASGHEIMCGRASVYAVMKASIMAGADDFQVLKYSTSGDSSGDKSRVVGYLSAAFVRTSGKTLKAEIVKREKGMFTKEEKKKLLGIARSAITEYLSSGEMINPKVKEAALLAPLGGFVTLHRNGSLRGCIGRMSSEMPFYRTVIEMALAAAFEDSRFMPVTEKELSEIDIEISALSPMRRVFDPSEIEMGKHGVMVSMGRRSGVYLPQVAVETGWSKEEFMNSLCRDKAGISESAWRTGEAEVYVYTAEVFGEKEMNENN